MLAYVIDGTICLLLMAGLLLLPLLGSPLLFWLSDRLQDARSQIGADSAPEEVALLLASALVLWILAATFLEIVYFTLCEFLLGGRTVGKWLVGLRVVGVDSGRAPTLSEALLRNVLRAVDVLPTSYATGLLAMIMSPSGQRLGDRVAGTLVVRRDRTTAAREIVVREGLEPLPLSREQAERLGPQELALLRGSLRRLEQLSGERRARLVRQVSDALAARLGVAPAELDPDAERLLERAWLTAERLAARD